jgi:hypothetical protein
MEAATAEKPVAKVKRYSRFKGQPMVHIFGNFFGGGFNLSKNKVNAVLENIDELKKFAAGEYDAQIAELADNEALEVSE